MQNITKNLLLSSLLCLTSPSLLADEGYGYIGVGAGYSMINANFLNSIYYLGDDRTTVYSKHKNYNADSYGLKLYGGYQFNHIIGIEGSFSDLGTLSSNDYSQQPQALSVSANAGYGFLNNQLRPFGLLGVGYLQTNQSYELLDYDYFTLHAGVGLEYHPTALKGFGIRAAFESDLDVSSQSAYNEDKTVYSYETFWQRYMLFYLGAEYRF